MKIVWFHKIMGDSMQIFSPIKILMIPLKSYGFHVHQLDSIQILSIVLTSLGFHEDLKDSIKISMILLKSLGLY